ncbi:MAG: oxygen-independent coproporphyrinogen III oxidase [Acetobacteraceae bacterium]|nr:oxygen-independent coproporphyrinogen III oxidase [Acetobacteraceae bacterium]
MSDALSRHAARAVPRYTSYPTAPHFQPGFPADTWREWLARTPPEEPVSLYLHVPYCRQMCWYCGCNMKLAAREAPVAAYAETLRAEIALAADALPEGLAVSHLHWGGGTPTALSPEDLSRCMARIASRFDVRHGAELAIESDPRTLSAEMIGMIGALGFTRASFGVQEFDPKVQAAINRIQPPGMVRRAVEGLRAAGVAAINFDLIYGLPHQTVRTLLETIAIACDMRPDRIALFGYAHVPWMAKNQRMIEADSLPGPAERAEQAARAAEALVAAGYVPIGLDHFALPEDSLAVAAREGRLRRNFQGYTTDQAETLIGLGATAISRTRFGYAQNIAETNAWARAVRAGVLPVAKGRALTEEDRLRAHVIERIMCDGAVDLDEAAARFGAAPGWWDRAAIEDLAADGLLTLSGARLALTPAGRPLCRVVAAAFDAYLPRSEARHSVAV